MLSVMNDDELFRYRMHRDGPPGYRPCTIEWPHEGPCSHEPEFGFLEFVRDYHAWRDAFDEARNRYAEAMPCLSGASCGYHVDTCRNCRLVYEAALAIAGDPPDPRDYRPVPKHLATCQHGNELSDCDACDGGDRDR